MAEEPPPPVVRLLDLSGRVAVVTGGSGTIGAGIARRLHEAGASVLVHANARPEAAEGSRRLARRPRGDRHRRRRARRRAICGTAVDVFGALDIVVNNAGVQPVVPFDEIDAGQPPSCCA